MDRAFLGYRKQHPPLLGRELTLELDLDVDLIDQAARAKAISAVYGVHLPVREVYLHVPQRPAFALGVHPHRDGLASSQCREKKFVGSRGGILASGTQGFVRLKLVAPGRDNLQEVW